MEAQSHICSREDALYCLDALDDTNLIPRDCECKGYRHFVVRSASGKCVVTLRGPSRCLCSSLATSLICNPPSTPFSSVPHHLLLVSLQPSHQAPDPSEIALWRSDRVNPALRIRVANLPSAASGGRLTEPDRSIYCPSGFVDITVGMYMSP